MSSPGRELLAAAPADWVKLHRERWPTERHEFQEAVGHLMSQALRGEDLLVMEQTNPNQPTRVRFRDLAEPDRLALDLSVPGNDEDGKPRTKGLDLQAVLLPASVRRDPVWAMHQLRSNTWTELTSLDAVLCSLILAPVLAELSAIFRLRAGEGPKTDKGRAEKLLRCRQAHDALGLETDLIEVLLDPTLDRAGVVEARQALVHTWSQHPEDVGARTIALLCAHLVRAYYSKARKDGTVQEARVITTTTKPLLDATLREWSALVSYVGEELAATDAQPVEVPEAVLPQTAPAPIADRMRVLHDWWQFYDARHAAQQPGAMSLDDLVPPRWFYPDVDDASMRRPAGDLYRTAPAPDLVARIERLWGTTVLRRHPSTLITQPHPFIAFGALLRPAVDAWQDLAMTCWWLCFGDYARYSLDSLEDAQAEARRELEKLRAPIDVAIYRELRDAGKGHDWLFEMRGAGLSITISLSDEGDVVFDDEDDQPTPAEANAVFLSLRSIVDRHRRRWLDEYLDRLLDAMWRSDLEAAAGAYRQRFRGKGSAPTVKQALPDVLPAAERWFGGDFGAMARVTGLEGPICEPPAPTQRRLPDDLAAVRKRVSQTLRQAIRANGIDEQEAAYRVIQFASRIDDVLVHWQAAGTAPPRSAVLGSGSSWLTEQLFGCDVDEGYALLLAAARDALGTQSHPAADELQIA